MTAIDTTFAAPHRAGEAATAPTARPAAAGLCLDCNYPLRNLPSPRCPECGREFNPADPATMNMGRTLSPWVLWVLGPMTGKTYVVTLAAMAVTLWFARLPTANHQTWPATIFVWIALGSLWVAWPVLRWAAARKFGWRRTMLTAGRRQGWIMPVVILSLIVGLRARLPLRAAFALSEPTMTAMAEDVLNHPMRRNENTWSALFPARHISSSPAGVRFTTEESDATYRAGFAYQPKVDPTRLRSREYRYLGHGWWTWKTEG